MKKKRVRILVAGLLLAAGLLGAWVLFRAPEAEVWEVRRQDFQESFREEGTVVAAHRRDLHVLHTAEVLLLHVSEGEPVREGDLLVTLESRELDHALRELEAQQRAIRVQLENLAEDPSLAAARLSVQQAVSEREGAADHHRRTESLYAGGAVSAVEREEAARVLAQAGLLEEQARYHLEALERAHESNRETLRAQRDALGSQAELLVHQQGWFELRAPMDGIVSALPYREGQMATIQVPVVSVFEPGALEVETMVRTEDIPGLLPGSTVDFLYPGRDRDVRFSGTIRRIAPEAQKQQSVLGLTETRVRVTLSLPADPPRPLAPGYPLDVEFIRDRREDALVVPRTALFREGGEDAVLRVENGRIRAVAVRLGPADRNTAVVEEGLSDGDLVVRDPSLLAGAEGSRVRPKRVE